MSAGVTKGGVTVKVLTGRSAAELLTYRDKVDEGQESHVFDATRHCSHDVGTQIAEWQDVRIAHGTDGAMKTTRARYETVDPEIGLHANGQRGTHVRYWDGKSNRWRKRLAGPGETPTHLRFAPRTPLEKESEATHTIYAFGRDMVNPDNPEDIDRAFQVVKAERDDLYPGLQESMWLEKNGKSGLVHVHVASNATIYENFTHGGKDYVAGKKMAGGIVNVDAVRASFENYLDEHPEYGFEQSLARVGTKEYKAAQRRSGQKDYWDQTRGKESNHDRMRRIAGEALEDPAVTGRGSFIAEMKTRGITVTETGLRRGVAGRNHDYTYRLVGAKKGDHGARGNTLGDMYSYDAIGAQLGLKAVGKELEADVHQRVGAAKPLPFENQPLSRTEQKELAELTESVEDLAHAEKTLQTAEEERQQKAEAAGAGVATGVGVAARAEKLAEAQSASDEAWARIRARETEHEAQQAAELAKREEILSKPVGQFEGMDRKEIARAVDDHVLVHTEWFGAKSGMVRTADIDAMRDSGVLTEDETKYLDDAWWALDRPTTRAEREGQTSPSTPAPSDVMTQRATQQDGDTIQNSVTKGVTPHDTASEGMTSSSAPAPSDATRNSAPVSTPAPVPWQSRLRDVDTTGRTVKMQARIAGVAALDERWHDSMPQTDEEHRAFEKEVKAAGGVASSFLQTYGDRVSSDMREELTRRAESREAAEKDRVRYLEEANAANDLKVQCPDAAMYSPTYQEHVRKSDSALKRHKETREQVDRGDYSRSDREREQKALAEARKRNQRVQTKANQEMREKEHQQDEGMSLG